MLSVPTSFHLGYVVGKQGFQMSKAIRGEIGVCFSLPHLKTPVSQQFSKIAVGGTENKQKKNK